MAKALVNQIRAMPTEELEEFILREAGDELSQFFVAYTMTLIGRDPERVLENCSGVMLMGYLIGRQVEARAGAVRAPRAVLQ